jgi:flagellar motility protein MotE (MotC chaperone)
MIRLLQKPWMISVVGALAYLGTTFVLLRPERLEAARKAQESPAEMMSSLDPSWNFRNPELEQLIAELRREKEAVKLKEQQLQAFEARLQTERNELTLITQSVFRLQREFDQNVIRLKEEEAVNYKKLAKLHAAMSPDGAAGLFREMPDEEVVKIFFYMKVDEVSQILEAFGRLGKAETKRATILTERMRRTIPPTPASKPNL